jgi:hypothetical protein
MIPGLFAGDRMRRFVEGADRGQSTLFPECLEDWIGEDNPVRVIDVFVDEAALTWTAGVAAGGNALGIALAYRPFLTAPRRRHRPAQTAGGDQWQQRQYG